MHNSVVSIRNIVSSKGDEECAVSSAIKLMYLVIIFTLHITLFSAFSSSFAASFSAEKYLLEKEMNSASHRLNNSSFGKSYPTNDRTRFVR